MAAETTVAPARAPIWRDPRYRGIFFQIVVLAAVIVFGYWIFHNTTENLARQGIASGFDFVDSQAGFGIAMSLVDYSEKYSTYGDAFIVGLLNTLLVSALGIVLATILGFVLGVARLSKNWLISRIAAVYIEIIRNIPLLLQIFFWYFALLRPLPLPRESVDLFGAIFLNNRGLYAPRPLFDPAFSGVLIALAAGILGAIFLSRWARQRQEQTGEQFPIFWASVGLIVGLPLLALILTGFPLSWEYPELKGFNFRGGMVLIPEFLALLVALSLYTASFIGEIVRAGIQAVSYGQTEAALSLGLRRGATLRLVVIPQALRVIVPPLTSQYLNLTKNSSLAAAIAYPELVSVWAGIVLNQTGQAVEMIATTMAVYLFLSLAISTVMNWYNARIALVER
jgi:general L-amino acid transport system permease protein